MIDLRTSFMGLSLKNPLVVGSSGLSGNLTAIKKLAQAGVGAIVLKSVFEEEIQAESAQISAQQVSNMAGNAEFFDYFDYELKQDILNKYATLIQKAKAEVDIPLIASINCASSGEWVSYAQNLEKAGADGIELNILYLGGNPNESAFDIEQRHFDIVKKVRQYTKVPVSVKVSPYFCNGAQFYHRLSQSGIAGLVLFNRMTEFDFDVDTRELTNGEVYSHSKSYAHTLRWISLLSHHSGCPISSSTGVHSSSSFIKMLMAGAHSVQVTSALYKQGPELIGVLLGELTQWMEKHKHQTIHHFRGCMARNVNEPNNQWERVQFMRYYSDHDRT